MKPYDVAEALLCGELGAVSDHTLTGQDGIGHHLDLRGHV